MGDDPGLPQGTPFALPKGVRLVGSIVGEEGWDATPTNSHCAFDGTGRDVTVTMTLRNDSTGSPVTVEFPPGLVIVSALEGFQHGLLVERVVVRVPPKPIGGGVVNDCKVTLMLSCLNISKNASEDGTPYAFGPVTNSPLLKDLIQRLSTKKTLYSEYIRAGRTDYKDALEKVQGALWSITDRRGLTEDDLNDIRSLPDK